MAKKKASTRTVPRKTATKSGVDGDPPVIYIHGIGDQPPLDEVKRRWDLAAFGREMGDRTHMAYWADVPHRDRPQRRAQAAGGDDLDVGALLKEAGVSPDNDQARRFASALVGVEGAGSRKKVLPLPRFLRKPITKAFLEALVKDSAAYFFRPEIQRRIRKRLLDVLPPGEIPFTLVAHSLGSVIAFDVLSALSASSPRRIHLITIGSPLGVHEFQDLLASDLKVPEAVEAWHNFADALDPVALDKGIGGDFEPARFIVDELVINTRSRLKGFNPHSAVGYLAHPKVREVIHRAARVDIHARFLVARDVAADLAIEERQPVLIEILEPGYPAVGESDQDMERYEKKESRPTLATRIENAAQTIEKIVAEEAPNQAQAKTALNEARVDKLRRFVAAHLNPVEISRVARSHRDLRIYAVWKSTSKRKLIGRSVRAIQADAAHVSYKALGQTVRWAVLDTGVRHDHPHFKTHETIEQVWDCTVQGPPKEIPKHDDRDGHGTHVAGIIAGASPDGGSVRGIAPETRLVVYKVLDDRGLGEDAWIIKALDHIADQNENNSALWIHGLNLSLGGPYDATVYGCGFTPICVELRRLWRSGVLVVVASGNEGRVEVATPGGEIDLNSPMSIGDPANLEDCIAVGSVNADRPHLYGVSSFSSRGPTSDGRLKPDVVAPGERIQSCNSRFSGPASDDLYRQESGTSMAAPHVSGLLAAFLSVRREFIGRPDEVKALLLRTSTDIGRDRYHQGHGIPNLMRMLLEA